MPLAEPDLLGLARRSLPLGEIRIGTSKEVDGKKGRQPVRLDTFRFTTPSQETALAVAELYGGTPAPWERRRGYFEVITRRSRVDVWVPPRGLAVDTNMEMWGGSPVKCLRRCNGKTERRSGQPCMCPRPDDPTDPDDVQRAYDERLRLSKMNPPRACKVLTRYNLAIPELPGLVGVWKLNTGSANAARWSADSGEVLERARDAEVFMPASLEITWWPGQEGNPYPVPILRPRQSMTQVAAGELPGGLDGLIKQLETGQAGSKALALTAGTPEAPAETAGTAPAAPAPEDDEPGIAYQIAALVPLAQTREDVAKLIARAKGEPGLLDFTVWLTPEGEDAEVGETLRALLDARWHELPAAPPPPARERRQRRDGPEEAHAARPPAPPATSPADGSGSLFDDDPDWGEGH